MKASTYNITLTGQTPLLMHYDNLDWASTMEKWRQDPHNKKLSTPGDDRTPAWTWIGSLYTDSGVVCIPADNLMTMLREGGAKCPTGKRGATYKRQTQSGLVVDQAAWPLSVGGSVIPTDRIEGLIDNADLSEHEATVKELGFSLFVKRAKIGQAKHVRVRPRFDTWSCSGSITVLDETITKDVLNMILDMAGAYCGLCDWRPSSPKSPGPFGKFTVEMG